MSLKFSMYIAWSEPDKAFIARVPELPGCMADGETPAAAAAMAYEVAEIWIETAKEIASRSHGRGLASLG